MSEVANVAAFHLLPLLAKPTYGARLEMLDEDSIWCPVIVMKVEETHDDIVTVRFEGWDSTFNQTVPWSSKRLAPLYSFTKSTKCLVELLSNKKKGHLNLWPCKVQFRMPHPVVKDSDEEDEETCLYAQQFLRDEPNVYIQPYCIMLLPKYVRDGLDRDGGVWLRSKWLKPWREDALTLEVLPEGFEKAFTEATKDNETVGALPAGAIEKGCLLKEMYRVNSRNGAQVRDGSIQITSVAKEEEVSLAPARELATVKVEASAGKKRRSGKKRAIEEDEEQATKPPAKLKIEKEGEGADDANVAKREQGEGKRDENSDESELEGENDRDDEDWVEKKPPAKRAKATTPKKRKKKSKVPSLEELAASVEIDRLLREANDWFHHPAQLDPEETLAATKKKLGSVQLLRLLKTKMCTRCDKRLGMYFHRHGYDQGPNSQTCPTCFFRDGSRGSTNWTSGQAEKGLRLKGLNDILSTNYRHSCLTTSGWCKGVKLYDDDTVTRAALDGYGSVWELHRGLAMYEKRRRKDSVGAVRSNW